MNLRQLEIFRAVMHHRTTVAAAGMLGMSQSAVSNAIKHAEDQLGFLLFERRSNRLCPTQEARLLLEQAEPLFAYHEAVGRHIDDLRAGRVGRLRVAATAELSASVLPGVVAHFLAERPGLHVHLDTLPLNAVIDMVDNGAADIGFGIAVHDHHGARVQPVLTLEAVCVCPAASPLAGLPQVTPMDCLGQRLVVPQSDNTVGMRVAQAFANASVPYAPDVEVRFLDVAKRLVEHGCGITIIDELSANAGPSNGMVVRPFLPRIELGLAAICPNPHTLSLLAQAFLRLFKAEAAKHLGQMREGHKTRAAQLGPPSW